MNYRKSGIKPINYYPILCVMKPSMAYLKIKKKKEKKLKKNRENSLKNKDFYDKTRARNYGRDDKWVISELPFNLPIFQNESACKALLV